MSIFGWSYPPGCNSVPGDDEYPCEVCGLWPNNCICPECPECGNAGDPQCYVKHGMERTQQQIDSLKAKEAEWEKANKDEAEFWANQEREELEREWY